MDTYILKKILYPFFKMSLNNLLYSFPSSLNNSSRLTDTVGIFTKTRQSLTRYHMEAKAIKGSTKFNNNQGIYLSLCIASYNIGDSNTIE